MQPVLAASDLTTGILVVAWIGLLLSLAFAKIQFRVMKERELHEREEAMRATTSDPA